MDFIPIDKEMLPEQFEVELGEENFIFEFRYNETYDFFICDLYDIDNEPIVLGEKLMINKPLWSEITRIDLPAPTLIPLDESNQTSRITYDNFGVSVFLYIDDVGEENE